MATESQPQKWNFSDEIAISPAVPPPTASSVPTLDTISTNFSDSLKSYLAAIFDGPSSVITVKDKNGKYKSGSNITAPLGDRYFMKTNNKCKITGSNPPKYTDRYTIIDNMRFASNGNFGLIPSGQADLAAVGNSDIIKSASGFDPSVADNECKEVTLIMNTMGDKKETKYITVAEYNNIMKNNSKAIEAMTVITEDNNYQGPVEVSTLTMDKKYITKFYIGSVTVVGLFIFYRLLMKSN
jgi:hypothetical protein